MSNYFLEGDTYFVLKFLNELTNGKKIEFNPETKPDFSLFSPTDYYVYLDPSKEIMDKIAHNNYIICFLDKNVDLRIDVIKKLKSKSEYRLFEPIPATDFKALVKIFPKLKGDFCLPTKNIPLKYNGTKQNYEWFDISLISDLYKYVDLDIYKKMFSMYIDIWSLTNDLWSSNNDYLLKICGINELNFENYFNRIRETSKDYIEVIQSSANTFSNHKAMISGTQLNEYRFYKIKEKLNSIKAGKEIDALMYIEKCLKNVREGSNQKIELIGLFYNFKNNVLK